MSQAPLSIAFDTSKAKTAVPMYADGQMVRFSFAGVKEESGEKGKTLILEWNAMHPAANTDGGQIPVGGLGSKIFDRIQLYGGKPEDETPWFVKKLSTRIDALLGTSDAGNTKGKPTRPDFNNETVAAMIGKEMVAKMKVKTGDYSGNEFGNLYFPGDLPTSQ